MAREDYKQKLQKLKRFTDQTIQEITQDKRSYKDFLDFQARLYKYRFEDSLLIYAQNPHAQACATYKQWNSEKVGRRIYRNPKTIHVFADDNQSQIKYLFELADTHGKAFRYPNKIVIPEEYQKAVLDSFQIKPQSDTFSKNFKLCVEAYVNQHYELTAKKRGGRSPFSRSEDYEQFVKAYQSTKNRQADASVLTELHFKKLLTDSVGYTLCQRFSIPKGIYDNEQIAFEGLEQIRHSKEMIMLLGSASQSMSKQIINFVNKTILEEERRFKHERNEQRKQEIDHSGEIRVRERAADISGSIGAGTGDGRTETPENGQIRENVGGVHDRGISGDESVSADGRIMESNDTGSAGRSHDHADRPERAVQAEEPKTNGIPTDGAVRQPDDRMGGGSHAAANRVQNEIENKNGALQKQGSFFSAIDKYTLEEDFYIKETLLNGVNTKASLEDIYNAFLDNSQMTGTQAISLIQNFYMGADFQHTFSDGMTARIHEQGSGIKIDFDVDSGKKAIELPWIHSAIGVIRLIDSGEYLSALQRKEQSHNEKQYELGYGHMGNGLTVWNRLEMKGNDYVTVAHIAPNRSVQFYDGDMPDSVKAEIERIAQTSTATVSATQDTPVFDNPPEPEKEAVTPEAELSKPHSHPAPPEPFYFENFKDIENTLDYDKYRDRDVIGYNKQGVKYSVYKMDTHVFISTETAITPWGEVLGYNDVPKEIAAKIKAANGVTEPVQEELSWKNKTEEPHETDITDISPAKEENSLNIQTPVMNADTAENFTIKSESDIGLSSGKTKYRQNADAIRLLQEIEKENRAAAPEEQAVLAKYSGFGGIPQAFDPDNDGWAKEYAELKELLSEQEYEFARASTLNAHFTGIDVVEAMYEGVKRMGFEGGNVLEPSMGTGNFFGKLPEEWKDKAKLYGVELDEITGRIAKQLYPKASIEIGGFEETKNPDNFFNLAVGNVPFGNYTVHDTKFNSKKLQIHDYFLAKSLDKVKPGGVIAFITSKGTMDKENPSFRRYMAERAELLGAIRLPNNAFKQSANTEVTTDILFLKKRDKLVDASEENWVYKGFSGTGRMNEDGTMESIPLNQYYIDNPHMMLGEMCFDRSMYGNEKETSLHPFSKPEPITDEELFKKRFEQLKQSDSYNVPQKEWLNRLQKCVEKAGCFDKEMLEDFPLIRNAGGYKTLNAVFDGEMDSIIEFVNRRTPDKSQIPLKELLAEAISFLPENVMKEYATLDDLEQEIRESIPADPAIKNYSYTVVDGNIYQRENDVMYRIDVSDAVSERIKMLIDIREATKHVIDVQLDGCTDGELEKAQNALNTAYDAFTAKFKTNINTAYNEKYFGDDAEFPLISSLEEFKDNGDFIKADIFTKRTIQPYRVIESVDTSVEALAVSLYEKSRIDIEYMAGLVKKESQEVIDELQGVIFKNPLSDNLDQNYDILRNWETIDEYCSGNVVEKLELAKRFAEENPIYASNIKALESVQPVPLQAHEISAGIGSRWIDEKYYAEFIRTHFNPNSVTDVKYFSLSNEWNVKKAYNRDSALESTNIFGTKRMNAYKLMETLLNQRSPKVFDVVEDSEGNEKRVLNKAETLAAKEAAKKMQNTFQKWIFDDPERREILVEKYNKLYNTERVRQFDGSFLRFEGMNPTKKLRDYQQNAVARILFGGNTLLAHVVGAGKTYTMTAAAMEMKRMGLANKPMFVVPNHLVNQWANEFKALYPTANILAATKKDFEKSKRQRFCARAATGDWDAIIIGHSSFGMIPVSQDRQKAKLNHDIKTARAGLQEAKKNVDDRLLVKQIERNIKSLEVKLKKLMDKPKDNVIAFENLGVDALFVDEADEFKNKYVFTKMGNIAGLSKSASEKSTDMELKCDFINEQNGSERNVVFATGTPISNSMIECYTMQSYLMKKRLEKIGLEYFDNWSAQFGETVTALELDVSGKGFKMRERFSKFKNVPELMNLFRMVTDIQTQEMLKLPIPEIEGGKPTVIAAEASPSQKALVSALAELSLKISEGEIPPEHYNMLCVTNDGRLGGLDMRAVSLDKFRALAEYYDVDIKGIAAEDYADSKVNQCVNKVYDIYNETEKDKLAQMIFCDVSTPKGGKKFEASLIREKLNGLFSDWGIAQDKAEQDIVDFMKKTATKDNFSAKKMKNKLSALCKAQGIEKNTASGIAQSFVDDVVSPTARSRFSVYNDIRDKLIQKGVKPGEIAFIHEADTDDQKEEIFRKMRSGELRILLGSTAKMGAGTNAQKKLIALHNLDCPWRPRDLEQRSGRILRFGNLNPTVRLFNYVTKESFDAYLWQLVEIKQRMISQIMSGNVTSRTFEEADTTTLNYAEVKAIATGNPKIRRKMELENEAGRLKTLEQQYLATKYELQDKVLKRYPMRLSYLKADYGRIEQDIAKRNEHSSKDFSMRLGKNIYSDKKDAMTLLTKAAGLEKYDEKDIGEYRGFTISVAKKEIFTSPTILLKGANSYKVELGDSELGNLTRIDNVLKDLDSDLVNTQNEINTKIEQMEVGKKELDKPFEHTETLESVESELKEILAELEIDKTDASCLMDENASENATDLSKEFAEDFIMEEEIAEVEMELV